MLLDSVAVPTHEFTCWTYSIRCSRPQCSVRATWEFHEDEVPWAMRDRHMVLNTWVEYGWSLDPALCPKHATV